MTRVFDQTAVRAHIAAAVTALAALPAACSYDGPPLVAPDDSSLADRGPTADTAGGRPDTGRVDSGHSDDTRLFSPDGDPFGLDAGPPDRSDTSAEQDSGDPVPDIDECNSEVLFRDDFEDGLDPAWTEIHDDVWNHREPGHYQSEDGSFEGAITWIGERPEWKNYVVQAKVRPDIDSGAVTIGFRTQAVADQNNGGNQYLFALWPDHFNTEDVQLIVTDDGNYESYDRTASPVRLEVGTWYTVELHVRDATFQAYLEFEGQRHEVYQAAIPKYDQGAISLRTYKSEASFDDLVVCR